MSVLILKLTEIVVETLTLEYTSEVLFIKLSKVRLCCCSVTKSCPALGDPLDCSVPGFSLLHHVPQLALTHVHWVDDAIQPSDFFYMILKRKHYVVDIILGKRYKQLLFFCFRVSLDLLFFFFLTFRWPVDLSTSSRLSEAPQIPRVDEVCNSQISWLLASPLWQGTN